MRRKVRLDVERLEERDTPAIVGMPWMDPQRLTLSFTPDGTVAGTDTSSMVQALNRQMPDGSWRLEILRAIQTWAVNANINVGLVADGGQALGSPGLVQGDTHFGDIRLTGIPLDTAVVASGNPFQPNGSTWSGDVVLNTGANLGRGSQSPYDLYSVTLHEAGHIFGLGDNSNPVSVLYSNYTGVRTGLSPQDVSDLQAAYGVRQGDAFDAKKGNGTLKGATSLGEFSTPITGDVTTLDDVDYYKFAAPSNLAAGTTLYVQVRTSGVSLLVPGLTVYDAAGNVVGDTAASSPLAGDLSVPIANIVPGATYYVRVGNATQSVFGIGGYQLALSAQNSITLFRTTTFVDPEHRQNDTIKSATRLTGRNSSATRMDFGYQASISESGDVDFYKVHSQTTTNGAAVEMIALVSASDLNGLAPRVEVFDSAQQPVAAQVIGNEAGFFSVQVLNAAADADYYVKVSSLAPNSSSHGTGNYFLGVNFNLTQTATVQSFSSGSLSQTNSQQVQSLSVSKSTAFHFILSADAGNSVGDSQVQMSVYDSKGNLAFRMAAYAGWPASTSVAYLLAGDYKVSYVLLSRDGSVLAATAYRLQGAILSDPIGPTLVGSTTTTTTDTVDYVWYDPSYLTLTLTYGWIDPYFYY